MGRLKWNKKRKKAWELPGNNNRKAEGILLDNKKMSIKVLVLRHDNYNSQYLNRKLKSAFKEDYDEEPIVIYAYRTGEIIITDRLGPTYILNTIVTLNSGKNYYSSGGISCGGSTIDYPVKAKYTAKLRERCHGGNQLKNYSKLIVV